MSSVPAAADVSAAAELLLETPAAVLLVLVPPEGEPTVIYANAAGAELAPGVGLPVGTTDWSRAAALRRPDGRPLEDSEHPLARVVVGDPVEGVPVSAARASTLTGAHEPLWAVAVPLHGAPSRLEHHVLLAFLRVRDPAAVGGAQAAASAAAGDNPPKAAPQMDLMARAMGATAVSFTVSDPQAADNPLVWINQAFTDTTGYTFNGAVGRNCRFLQGPDTDRAAVARLREAIAAERTVTEVLLNYRADGTPFWNEVSINPVFDGSGHIVTDVSRRTADQAQRDAAQATARSALGAEQQARAAAEQARAQAERARRDAVAAQGRLSLLAEATGQLITSFDERELADRLAQLCVPMLADWAVVALLDRSDRPDSRPVYVQVRHRDGHADLTGQYARRQLDCWTPTAGPGVIAATGEQHTGDVGGGQDLPLDLCGDRQLADLAAVLGAYRHLTLPLTARRHTVGTLSLVWGRPHHQNEAVPSDVARMARDLAGRAALALDNARLYTAQHDSAVQLQRSLLPTLPQIEGVRTAAAYLPGAAAHEVGGDWYDVLPLPDGAVGLVIGDVMGHDLHAAAAMGRLRSAVRAYTVDEPSPAAVLSRVDRLNNTYGDVPLATCAYVRMAAASDHGRRTLTYTNAGHHAPLLRRADGSVTHLDDEPDVLLGVDPRLAVQHRRDRTVTVEPDNVLLLYTDGLIERRGGSLADSLTAITRLLAAHQPADGPQSLVDKVTEHLLKSGQDDDVRLLAVTL